MVPSRPTPSSRKLVESKGFQPSPHPCRKRGIAPKIKDLISLCAVSPYFTSVPLAVPQRFPDRVVERRPHFLDRLVRPVRPGSISQQRNRHTRVQIDPQRASAKPEM